MGTATFKLGVLERMVLNKVLMAVQGDITRLRQMREFREILSFTDEEIAEFQITSQGDDVSWENGREVDFEITDEFQKIIKHQLKRLNDGAMLAQEHITIYEMFVEGKDANKNQ